MPGPRPLLGFKGFIQGRKRTHTHTLATPNNPYQHFIQTQRDDLAPDLFKAKYEEYQLDYLEKFSTSYFHTNKRQEWFQDRYNPLNVLDRENANAEWAREESEYVMK